MTNFVRPSEQTIKHFINVEGYSETAYQDSLGNWTIGIGHLLSTNPKDNFDRYMWKRADILEQFFVDYNIALKDAKSLYSNFDDLTDNQQLALVDLAFNLGLTKLKKFHKTNKLINEGQFDKAADNLLTTLWAKQVKRRAKITTDLLRTSTKQ